MARFGTLRSFWHPSLYAAFTDKHNDEQDDQERAEHESCRVVVGERGDKVDHRLPRFSSSRLHIPETRHTHQQMNAAGMDSTDQAIRIMWITACLLSGGSVR
jgi:hypothetical protein